MKNNFDIKFEKELLEFNDVRNIYYHIQDYLLENFNKIKIDNWTLDDTKVWFKFNIVNTNLIYTFFSNLKDIQKNITEKNKELLSNKYTLIPFFELLYDWTTFDAIIYITFDINEDILNETELHEYWDIIDDFYDSHDSLDFNYQIAINPRDINNLSLLANLLYYKKEFTTIYEEEYIHNNIVKDENYRRLRVLHNQTLRYFKNQSNTLLPTYHKLERIFLNSLGKDTFNDILKHLESSVIIPNEKKENIKNQILNTYNKTNELGECFDLDYESYIIFMSIKTEIESCNMNKKEFSEYGFLYEYWNGMNY